MRASPLGDVAGAARSARARARKINGQIKRRRSGTGATGRLSFLAKKSGGGRGGEITERSAAATVPRSSTLFDPSNPYYVMCDSVFFFCPVVFLGRSSELVHFVARRSEDGKLATFLRLGRLTSLCAWESRRREQITTMQLRTKGTRGAAFAAQRSVFYPSNKDAIREPEIEKGLID